MNALHLNGNDLTLEAVREVADQQRPVLLLADAREAVDRARAIVDEIVASNKLAYAITTGVGKLSDVRIAGEQIRELQVNLVRSHAVGVGEPLSVAETRAMMLLRANSLAKGYSGVRAIMIDTLCEMLNRGVTPFVPSQGSVGASGDLAPLAHLALALIGEGECVDARRAHSQRRRAEAGTDQAAGARSKRIHLAHQRNASHAGRRNFGAAGRRDISGFRRRVRRPLLRCAQRHRHGVR